MMTDVKLITWSFVFPFLLLLGVHHPNHVHAVVAQWSSTFGVVLHQCHWVQQFQSIRRHLAVGLSDSELCAKNHAVVLQVAADGKIDDLVNPVLLKLALGSDAGQHENL